MPKKERNGEKITYGVIHMNKWILNALWASHILKIEGMDDDDDEVPNRLMS